MTTSLPVVVVVLVVDVDVDPSVDLDGNVDLDPDVDVDVTPRDCSKRASKCKVNERVNVYGQVNDKV